MYLYSLQNIGGAKYEARPQEIGKNKHAFEWRLSTVQIGLVSLSAST